jgi:hypothetical protein
LIKQKKPVHPCENRKSNRLASSVQPQIQKPIKGEEALDRYVDKKINTKGKEDCQDNLASNSFKLCLSVQLSATNESAFEVSFRRLYASGVKSRNFLGSEWFFEVIL